MAIRSAFRVTISYAEKSFKLESAIRVEKVTPPSAKIEGPEYGVGAWFTVEGAGGHTLYRRVIDNPFDGHEVPTGEERGMRRVRIPNLPQAFTLLIPDIQGAEALAVYASQPPVRAGQIETAKRVFHVSMRDVAALAAKGGSTHGR
jgi:hypothetical protein